jgi:phosphatidylserine/phosphatidylglycerophosphate/cardiolipin synthase-like enzyme
LNDKKIENYFCPEDSCSSHVIENLKEAKTEVYFLAFSFTHDGIGQTLLDLNNKGVRIQGVFEKTRQNEFSEYYNLNNSINVKWDEYKYVMHHKVFIIDNKTVITGSFNPTESADKSNDENVLIIHDEDIAKKYLKEFDQIWNFEENLDTTEKEANSILISEVYYDCTGKDEEEEFVELYNPTSQDVNLDYYFISDGKNNQRLDGIIKTGTTKIIKPKFSLSNKGSYIVLKRGFEQVDFVSWESIWNLEAKTGQSLQRRNFEKVNSIDQWTVGKPNIE